MDKKGSWWNPLSWLGRKKGELVLSDRNLARIQAVYDLQEEDFLGNLVAWFKELSGWNLEGEIEVSEKINFAVLKSAGVDQLLKAGKATMLDPSAFGKTKVKMFSMVARTDVPPAGRYYFRVIPVPFSNKKLGTKDWTFYYLMAHSAEGRPTEWQVIGKDKRLRSELIEIKTR